MSKEHTYDDNLDMLIALLTKQFLKLRNQFHKNSGNYGNQSNREFNNFSNSGSSSFSSYVTHKRRDIDKSDKNSTILQK